MCDFKIAEYNLFGISNFICEDKLFLKKKSNNNNDKAKHDFK